jgi:ribosomal protein L40E
MLELMRDPAGQQLFFTSCNPEFRAFAADKLVDAGFPLDTCVFKSCPLHALPRLAGCVNWALDNEAYAEAIGQWLSEARLSGAEARELIVSVAMQMHDEGMLLSPTMWEHLPTVVRIRLLIYWSNHYANLDDYVVRGGIVKLCKDAYWNSWEGYDPTLKAAMLLFSLPLARDVEKAFCDANDALVGEMVRQFNECDAGSLRSFALSEELQALLQRCGMYTEQQLVRGFCDGRKWRKGDGKSSVWCHGGVDRPHGGRRECKSLRSPMNARGSRPEGGADAEHQFMADFLYNVSNAMGECMNVGSILGDTDMDLVEYAYRISSYVNKMSSVLPHMVCRGCGSRLALHYRYPREQLYNAGSPANRRLELPFLSPIVRGPSTSATVCGCPRAGDGNAWHDASVYINYCLNCHRVIDSRECAMKDQEGYYLCMYCGASRLHEAATVCPRCGNNNPDLLGYYTGSMTRERSCFDRS